jgi:hypothetical protein
MPTRSQYWSNTKLAEWIRGTEKPSSETAEGWNTWRKMAEAAHPVRYWIAEEGLDALQNFLWWPADKLYEFKYYVNNRWITRTHALTAHPRDIRPGQWHDVGNRFLPCLFNELVDFVEVELAWWHLAWEGKEERKKYNMPWWAVGWWRVRTWRCAEAGLDNLEWQRRLTVDENDPESEPTQQAKNAQEILDLYNWWTQVYRNRVDAMEASGWSALCDEERQLNGGVFSLLGTTDKNLRQRMNQAHKIMQKLEREYEKEDEAMMIRLIKVRHALWT